MQFLPLLQLLQLVLLAFLDFELLAVASFDYVHHSRHLIEILRSYFACARLYVVPLAFHSEFF